MKKITQTPVNALEDILARPLQSTENLESIVQPIFNEVKQNGDIALKKYSLAFDGFPAEEFMVSQQEFNRAEVLVSKELKKAIQQAKQNIEAFHLLQDFKVRKIETSPGVVCWQDRKAIEKVGLYIPGGSAPLFSTVLMLGIPAIIAGCKEIILCTPPDKNGKINPAILYTAQLIGLKNIYKLGGIQAIAAISVGTESIPLCNKLFGPGNQYVTAAKTYAQKLGIAIDMPAGPSELMVVANAGSNPAFIAADLLSQAEHGADSQVILLSTEVEILNQVEKELEYQIEQLPRKEIARESLKNGRLIYLKDDTDCLQIINQYAPEHLILMVEDEDLYLENIQNAGSVFLGKYSPESAGDYASGTNHTLPTSGFATSYSGLGVDSFCKYISYQKLSAEGILNLGSTIEIMAAAEGLDAHKNAVSIRLKTLKGKA